VVLQKEDRSWWIAWFAPSKSGRHGCIALVCGGSWECDLNEAERVEPISAEQLKELGLDHWEREADAFHDRLKAKP
jgi:hypothetical protein